MFDFVKYEGLGNDFVLVDTEFDPSLASNVCDRHRGVGADGVIVISTEGTLYRMVVWNADGTRPEMCGNGLRCVAKHLVATGRAKERTPFKVLTDAGPHSCEVDGDQVLVHMAVPTLVPSAVPVQSESELIDTPVEVDGSVVHLTAVSMGNPHAVTFDPVDADALGPLLEGHELFPDRANIGFATPQAAGMLLRVFERGVGWTQACGTGACAAAVAAVVTGRAKRGHPQRVELPGGNLTITVPAPDQRVQMQGPAHRVFTGKFGGTS